MSRLEAVGDRSRLVLRGKLQVGKVTARVEARVSKLIPSHICNTNSGFQSQIVGVRRGKW